MNFSSLATVLPAFTSSRSTGLDARNMTGFSPAAAIVEGLGVLDSQTHASYVLDPAVFPGSRSHGIGMAAAVSPDEVSGGIGAQIQVGPARC